MPWISQAVQGSLLSPVGRVQCHWGQSQDDGEVHRVLLPVRSSALHLLSPSSGFGRSSFGPVFLESALPHFGVLRNSVLTG